MSRYQVSMQVVDKDDNFRVLFKGLEFFDPIDHPNFNLSTAVEQVGTLLAQDAADKIEEAGE